MKNKNFNEDQAKIMFAEQQIAAIKIQHVANNIINTSTEIKGALASFSSKNASFLDSGEMPKYDSEFIIDFARQKLKEIFKSELMLDEYLSGDYGIQLKLTENEIED